MNIAADLTARDIIAKILDLRGIPAAEMEDFIHPSFEKFSKAVLPGVPEAAKVILETIRAKERIVVFGDYDCDGVAATAIVTKTLTALGASVEPFLPERLSEGYGMSEASVKRLLREVPDVALIVTVDNGVNAIEPIAKLKEMGLKVVVTDHHLPGETLPAADALVDPKVESPDEWLNLCGAGVAFLLANHLVSEARASGLYTGPNIGGPLLILAGLATVTDIMPLLGQNRLIVHEALRRFGDWAPLGLKELYQRAARVGAKKFTARDFAFLLGPRINAAGRLKSGMEALELILSDDREIARELARIVDMHNVERKDVEQKMTEEAISKIVEGASAPVIDLPDGHPGVAGIVAARILERLGNAVPVCVLAGSHGSARSPEGLNIRDAFVACQQYLLSYGGHAAAGGLSVKPGEVDNFRKALCDYCTNFRATTDVPVQKGDEPDLWLNPNEISLELAEALECLEPFGEGNEEPRFGIRDVRFFDVKPLGADGRHLSVTLGTLPRLKAVWWGRGDLVEELRMQGGTQHDIVFTLFVSDYGERHVELKLTHID